jgi:hypothetical protein
MRRNSWSAMCVVPLLLPSISVYSQSRMATQQAPNYWMKSPTPQNQWDSVDSSSRSARDEFWDQTAAASRQPLTPESAPLSAAEAEGPSTSNTPELPSFAGRSILTGSFASFRSRLSRSGRIVYTEITFRVYEVIEAPDTSDLRPGSDITVCFPGGSVLTSSGKVISYLSQPRKHFLQPSRSYLLVLRFHSEGAFYTLGKDWDITDGKLRPNTEHDELLAETGKSFLSGATTADAIQRIREYSAGNR